MKSIKSLLSDPHGLREGARLLYLQNRETAVSLAYLRQQLVNNEVIH